MVAQANSTKELDLEDVIKFPWDNEMDEEQTHERAITDEKELEDLRKRAKNIKI